jgi:membrane protein DedA with SNARE-associated domain
MEHRLFDLLVHYGAPLVFAAQLLGIFGLPIPDELLLTIAGALARRGALDFPTILVAAIAGCLSGISFSYLIGRTVGLAALRRFHASEQSVELACAWFKRFGSWLLTFGYFVPGVRHVTAIAAGPTLNYRTFAAYAYPGGVLWSTTFVTLGYIAGDRWRPAMDAMRRHLATGIAALAVIAAVYAIVAALRQRA